jgi:hypothetical protein
LIQRDYPSQHPRKSPQKNSGVQLHQSLSHIPKETEIVVTGS